MQSTKLDSKQINFLEEAEEGSGLLAYPAVDIRKLIFFDLRMHQEDKASLTSRGGLSCCFALHSPTSQATARETGLQ